MLASLDKRFPTTETVVTAALLDCRFMRLKEIETYLDAHQKTPASCLAECVNEIKGIAQVRDGDLQETTPTASTSKQVSLLTQLSRKHSYTYRDSVNNDDIDQEVWKYIATADPGELEDGDLLAYWK